MLVDRPATSSKGPNMSAIAPAGTAPESAGGRSFLLERVQPALSGLMDGSLSTLAPIFAVALVVIWMLRSAEKQTGARLAPDGVSRRHPAR